MLDLSYYAIRRGCICSGPSRLKSLSDVGCKLSTLSIPFLYHTPVAWLCTQTTRVVCSTVSPSFCPALWPALVLAPPLQSLENKLQKNFSINFDLVSNLITDLKEGESEGDSHHGNRARTCCLDKEKTGGAKELLRMKARHKD